jgi:hypothetical protein
MPMSWWWKMLLKRMKRSGAREARRVFPRLRVESLEDRIDPAGIFASAVAAGSAPVVTVFDATTRAQKFTVNAYDPSFTGGVNVAVGDVNGDGTPDLITGPGAGGGPVVDVYSGTDGSLLKTLSVGDDTSRAGATVAAADFNGDGKADIVVGTMRNGAPLIQVVQVSDESVLLGFTPFAGAQGVSVAAGDVNGDGTPDVVAAAGPGTTPQVIAYDGSTRAELLNTAPFEDAFTGGAQVATGDLDGDGKADVIVSAGFAGGPRVVAFSGATGGVLQNFFAYDQTQRSGVTTVAYDADGNGTLDLVCTDGPGQTAGVTAFDGKTLATMTTSFTAPPVGATFETTPPTATVASSASGTTATTPIPFTVTFDEAVNGFTSSGLAVTNGTVSNFTATNAKTYTFDVTPTADGAVSVSVATGVATDAAGNANTASAAYSVTYTTAGPPVTADALTTNSTTPTLTGTVGDSAASVAVVVGGQTLTATVSGTTWSAAVPAPLAEGTYDIRATAADSAGHTSTATRTGGLVIDTTAPTATVSSTASDPTSTSPISFTVTLSEDVTGFTTSGLTVTNGTVSGFTATDAKTYTFNVAPTSAGAVTVGVTAGAATDAAGNGNTASATITRTFTGTATIDASGMVSTMPDVNAPQWQTQSDGLRIWDVQTGSGTVVTSSTTNVEAYYTGWLAGDGTQFDSNRTSSSPASFSLSGLITGWQEGLIGMQPSGIRRLSIPAALAYGSTAQGSIPANSDLVFEIKLVSSS